MQVFTVVIRRSYLSTYHGVEAENKTAAAIKCLNPEKPCEDKFIIPPKILASFRQE